MMAEVDQRLIISKDIFHKFGALFLKSFLSADDHLQSISSIGEKFGKDETPDLDAECLKSEYMVFRRYFDDKLPKIERKGYRGKMLVKQ